jgi:CheY-like chemotaxis protein
MMPCPHCGDAAPPFVAGVLHQRCNCGAMLFAPKEGPTVLVVFHDDPVAQQLGALLAAAGYHVVRVADSASALTHLARQRYRAVVIDATLEGTGAFAVVEHLRGLPGGSSTRVVLVARVHSKTAYKRPPSKLYGADAYLELHRAGESLVTTLQDLLTGEVTKSISAAIRMRALALSIVADIAQANLTACEAAVHTGDVSELKTAMDEGRRLLAEMTGSSELGTPDPVTESMTAFIAELRRACR